MSNKREQRVFDQVLCEMVDFLDDAGLPEHTANETAHRIVKRIWKLAGRIHSAATKKAIGQGVRRSKECKALSPEEFRKYLTEGSND